MSRKVMSAVLVVVLVMGAAAVPSRAAEPAKDEVACNSQAALWRA